MNSDRCLFKQSGLGSIMTMIGVLQNVLSSIALLQYAILPKSFCKYSTVHWKMEIHIFGFKARHVLLRLNKNHREKYQVDMGVTRLLKTTWHAKVEANSQNQP